MSVERIFHCDGPECDRHIATSRDYPPTFIVTEENHGTGDDAHGINHFCGWDCLLRFAAKIEPEEIIQS